MAEVYDETRCKPASAPPPLRYERRQRRQKETSSGMGWPAAATPPEGWRASRQSTCGRVATRISMGSPRGHAAIAIVTTTTTHAAFLHSSSTSKSVLLLLVLAAACLSTGTNAIIELPSFRKPVSNVTSALGREAVLDCAVDNLSPYKVAWLKVDTQTILTIHNHVITKNSRIGVSHSELNVWRLHIKDVRESDEGWYMCQINTDPMKSQTGYLNVVVPPDILDYPTSADMVVDEGSNVSLKCIAKGSPEPSIIWKREDGELIRFSNGTEVSSATGPILNITNVKRDHMGPYLCIASNGVPPSVSKRIKLVVQFSPSVWIQYQLIGAYDGQQVTLECFSQAFPKSVNYWAKDNGDIIPHSTKYVPEIIEDGYKIHMKLKIRSLGPDDYGIYKCVSKNSLGDMEGSINVYRYEDNIVAGSSKKVQEVHPKRHPNDTSRRISLEHDEVIDLQSYYSDACCGHDDALRLSYHFLPVFLVILLNNVLHI